MINVNQASEYVFVIEKAIKYKNIIDKYQDWLNSTIHSLETEDSNSKNHNMNTRYKYSTNVPESPSELDPLFFLCKVVGLHTPNIHRNLYGSALQTVQQYFYK